VRDQLKGYFDDGRMDVFWIFLSSILSQHPTDNDVIYLKKGEREFATVTECDEIMDESIGSLHYLYVDTRRLATYRRLKQIHPPNIHRGQRKESGLDELLVDGREVVAHPGERAALIAARKRNEVERERARIADERARVRTEQERANAARHRELAEQRSAIGQANDEGEHTYTPAHPTQVVRSALRIFTCKVCGLRKPENEFSMYQVQAKSGTCRPCLRSGG
jgi:hypothetical protein